MFQTLREVIAANGGDAKTDFLMKAPNGVQFKAASIEEGQELAKNYSNTHRPQRK